MEAKRLVPPTGENDAQSVARRPDRRLGSARNRGANRFESAALIVNTRSRVGRHAAASALDSLGLLGVPVEAAYALDDASRIRETVRGALADGHDLIVLGGGDGSVGSAAGVLAGGEAVLGVLPLGTANDFARTLGIPFELGAACATVADGVVAGADLGLAGDHHYVNVASVGLGSAVAETVSPRLKRAVGPLAYPFAAVRAYLDHEPFEAAFAFPDGDHESVAMDGLIHVAVGNGRYYGGGMIVAPDSAIEDHALDVYAVEAAAAPDLARIAWGLRTGNFVRDERVHHWRTGRVRIFTDPQLPINLDGELVCRTPRTFSVLPDALKVLVPGTSPVTRSSRATRRPNYNGPLVAPASDVAREEGKVGAQDGSSPRRRAFWLLARHERGRVEVLAAELVGGGKALPVFSFAEEAELFLGLGGAEGAADEGDWRVWRTEAGELASVLLGPCRGVGRVALDPMPEVGAGPVNRLASVGRERFVRFLLGESSNGGPARIRLGSADRTSR